MNIDYSMNLHIKENQFVSPEQQLTKKKLLLSIKKRIIIAEKASALGIVADLDNDFLNNILKVMLYQS